MAGGLGIRRDYQFPYGPVTFCIISDRAKFAPWGVAGGGDATGSKYVHNPGRSDQRSLPSKGTVEIAQGDSVSVQTGGGGGYGDPALRLAKAIRRDIELGKVTAARARRDYGIEFEDAHL